VWSRYPDADIKQATMLTYRGLRRWQKSPAHRGDHEGSRKTIAQGMFWHKNALNINVVRVLCRRLCRDPQKLLIAVKNSSAGR
jgi:hypothetical protein